MTTVEFENAGGPFLGGISGISVSSSDPYGVEIVLAKILQLAARIENELNDQRKLDYNSTEYNTNNFAVAINERNVFRGTVSMPISSPALAIDLTSLPAAAPAPVVP